MVTSLDPSAVGVPEDGSVTTIKLADNAVTNPKIAPQQSTKISGLAPQTQSLGMAGFQILNVGLMEIDAIGEPTPTGAATVGKFYMDTTLDNHLTLKKNSVPVDIEAPALGLSTGESGLTASTTQTQGEGQLSKVVNEISIVANNDDTVTLPTAIPFLNILIINNGVRRVQIFPSLGDDLGSGVNVSTSMMAGSNVRFVAFDDTNWELV